MKFCPFNRMQRHLSKLFTLLSICFAFAVGAQQNRTLEQCEKAFLQSNLNLLAEHYNVSMAEAQVVQARLWDNPYFTAELNAVDPQNKKVFNAGSAGQKAFAVQQLIYLGGKKKKEVALATSQAQVAGLRLKELLQDLRYRLRTTFFSIYYDQFTAASIEKQLAQLDSLTGMYAVQVQKGNIPLRDLVRLQSLQMALKNDRAVLQNSIVEEQKNLSVLVGSEDEILPFPDSTELLRYQKQLPHSLEELLQLAQKNRVNLMLADKQKETAGWNWKWQRALAVPDLTLGGSYDQNGGAFAHQFNLTLGVPLRLWNKNQGNIKGAEAQYEQACVLKDQVLLEQRSAVVAAWKKYKEALSNYGFANATVSQHFEEVYQGVFQNFQRRNISLIEFADFMESYTQSRVQLNAARKTLMLVCEELNYATGSILF